MSDMELPESWKCALAGEFDKPYMAALKAFLQSERACGKTIFPKEDEIFRALDLTPPQDVRVIILGQDPYHGDDQAHGLAFSVNNGVRVPPSLKNIYKEITRDLGIPPPVHGFLEGWAKQGVLLLNTVLTVERSLAASHKGKGWEQFTDAIISHINKSKDPVVFMLWGSHAQKKAAYVDRDKHLALTAPHPSPLSAHRGFLGCGHFTKANDFLTKSGQVPINWSL